MEPETIVKNALGDKYEILSIIGKGGMATVFKAIQKSLNRPVALKVIHQNLVHDEEFIKRFIREAQVCASLRHPNIITIHDVGSVDTVHYIAMDYLEGQNLREIIQLRGFLGWEETLKYIEPIAEALDYMHQHQVIHRDVKSANIFITNQGQPVLMDFGIVFSASQEALSQSGYMLGTPEYMSPEQAEGKIKIDGRSDIYSLGVILFECLCGQLPFHSDNYVGTLHQVIYDSPPDVNILNPKVPAWLTQLVNACLVKDRNFRIQDGLTISTVIREKRVVIIPTYKSDLETKKMMSPDDTPKKRIQFKKESVFQINGRGPIISLIITITLLLIIICFLILKPFTNKSGPALIKQVQLSKTDGNSQAEGKTPVLSTTTVDFEVNLTITDDLYYYINNTNINHDKLEPELIKVFWNKPNPTILIRLDPRLSAKYVDEVVTIASKHNYKVVLTLPKGLWILTPNPHLDTTKNIEEAISLNPNIVGKPAVREVDPYAAKKKMEKIEADKKIKEHLSAERILMQKEDVEKKRISAEQLRESDIKNRTKNALANSMNRGTNSSNQVNEVESAVQEDSLGSINSKVQEGDQGISYNLQGRGFQKLPPPKYNYEGEGRVVVEVSVDRAGKVLQATPGVKGSTTLDDNLLKTAKEAALGSSFEVKQDAPAVQKGTITYNFIKIK